MHSRSVFVYYFCQLRKFASAFSGCHGDALYRRTDGGINLASAALEPHSYRQRMQHSLTAAAAAEDGELLALTSPCRVTSAERSLGVKIRRSADPSVPVSERTVGFASIKRYQTLVCPANLRRRCQSIVPRIAENLRLTTHTLSKLTTASKIITGRTQPLFKWCNICPRCCRVMNEHYHYDVRVISTPLTVAAVSCHD